MIRLFFIFIFFGFLNFAQGQKLILLSNDEFKEFGNHIAMLEDHTGKLTINDIINSKNFITSQTDIGSLPPTMSFFWIKFQVKNLTGKKYFLEIENPTLDIVEVYNLADSVTRIFKKTGDLLPFSSRPVNTNVFLFPLNLEKDKIQTFYIRYSGTEGLEMPLRIGTPEIIINRSHDRDLANGIYFGIVLVTVLYNLGIFFIIRDRSYLFYILFVFSFGLMQAELLGLGLEYFWPEFPRFNTQSLFIFGGLAGVFSINFVRNFLETKYRVPKLHKAGYGVESLFLLTIILALFSPVLPSSFLLFNEYLISFIVIIFSPYMIIIGIVTLLQKFRPARFFLIAWGIFLIGLVIFILKANGFIDHNLFTNSIMQIGSGMEAILLSLALGDRYNVMKKEKEKRQEELNRELQSEVNERIEAQEKLRETNKNLLKINTDLDNFVYTASHDLKAPIVNIEGLINDLKTQGCYADADVKAVLDMMAMSVEKFKTTIYDLTEITKAQKNLEENIERIEIKEIIEEIQLSINRLMKETGAKIQLEPGKNSTIMFPKKNFKSIMHNLIINAIKYRSPERKPDIFISASSQDDYIVISVKDNGLGINESQKDKVFSMFKRAHDHVEGTGVGLYIVKRIVENYGGKVELESEEGKGSVFRVYFKKFSV
jgi:signal transduction histidine kinase